MVHDPSGYIPKSIEKFHVDMRVKCLITSTSETSGTPSRSSLRRSSAGIISSILVSSTSNFGRQKPIRPVCDRSKIKASFCVGCCVTFLMLIFYMVIQLNLFPNMSPLLIYLQQSFILGANHTMPSVTLFSRFVLLSCKTSLVPKSLCKHLA